MIESKYYPDPTCIYNWTFKDNDSVVNNSAVKSTKNGNPTFSGGVATFNGSTDYYRLKSVVTLGTKHTTEVRFKIDSSVNFSTIETSVVGGGATDPTLMYIISISGQVRIYHSSGLVAYCVWVNPDYNWHTYTVVRNGTSVLFYLDSVLLTTTGVNTATSNTKIDTICATTASSFKFKGSLEYIRIWNRTLTAYEVTNNYRGVTFKALPYSGSEVLGSELVVNGDFSSSGGWNFSGAGSAFTIADGVCKINNGATASLYLSRTINKITGNLYKLTFTVTSFTSGLIIVYLGVVNGRNITAAGTYTIYTNATVDTNVYIQTLATNTICEIDNISIKEVYQSTYNPLFHITSYRGVIRDMLNKVTPVNTDTTLTKIGSNIKVMQFNGTSGNISLGNNALTGDITFMGWVNVRSLGEGNNGRILSSDNLFIDTSSNRFRITRNNGSNVAQSASASISYSKWLLLVITSTSAGISNLYLANTKDAPVLSGTANQSTPIVANTTPILLGNRSSDDRTFDGQIGEVRVDNSILSLSDITQFWSDTKSLYQ